MSKKSKKAANKKKTRNDRVVNSFSIHFRVTKRCNANCDYCSSAGKNMLKPMSLGDFKTSIDYLINNYLPKVTNLDGCYITMNYLGGEVLTLKTSDFREAVLYARDAFRQAGAIFRDGMQSNLIASKTKIEQFRDLFGPNIGTSVDNFSGKRKIGDSPERYNKLMNANIINVFSAHPPATFVLDDDSVHHLTKEYELSQLKKYDLTIRPIIKCGSNVDTGISNTNSQEMVKLFKEWHLKGTTRVEPFYNMMMKKISLALYGDNNSFLGCHFQSNCIQNNVNIDPDGDIYLCNEMADGGNFLLGNTLTGSFSEDNFEKLNNRQWMLPFDCVTCEHIQSCRGGCMNSALENENSLYGKDALCGVWKEIFSFIDLKIDQNPNYLEDTQKWLLNL